MRMARCGSVHCRVLRADGTPAAAAFVSLQAPAHDPSGPFWEGETDAAGTITFRAVGPAPYRVHARATKVGEARTTVETVVHPEQTSGVQIVLGT